MLLSGSIQLSRMDKQQWFTQLQSCLAASTDRISQRWATIATIRGPLHGELSGRPAVRTVNVRDVSAQGLKFVSDTRSGKARDVGEGPSEYAELCWFFPEKSTQLRISGKLLLNDRTDDAERAEYWASITPEQRVWWAYPAPGSERNEKHGVTVDSAVVDGNIPEHFCVCTLHPDYVEVLDMSTLPMRREQYTADADEKWTCTMVYP